MTNTDTTATIFNFRPTDNAKASQTVRTITIEGEPWFVAKDVAEALGYAKPREAVRVHCNGAAFRGVIDALGRMHEMTIIPERDLYRLVMRSKLPSAERFEEWVVGTVLPAIRRTGSYIVGEEALDPSAPDHIERLQDLLIKAQGRKLEAAEAKIAVLQPKAQAFHVFEEAEGSFTVTEAAKALKAKRTDLFTFLEKVRWVTRGPNREASAAAIRRGYMAVRTSVDPRGRAHMTPVVTPKGLAYLAAHKAKQHSAGRQAA